MSAISLSNGRFSTRVGAAGGGGATWGTLAVTRWSPDATRDADGCWLYIRDLDTGEFWSAAAKPVATGIGECITRSRPGVVELQREQNGVVVLTEVCVVPDMDAELRRITLENRSGAPRRLELTTYAELVLNSASADAGHPAFSKLFVQTGFREDEQGGALLAWRRLRSPDDKPMWVAHRFLSFNSAQQISFETDRMRFLGRGRTTSHPVALDTPGALSGTLGNVLDPIFAMRCPIELRPGERARFVSVLAAGDGASIAEESARFADEAAVDAAFTAAEARARPVADLVDSPTVWTRAINALASRSSAAPTSEQVTDAAANDRAGDVLEHFNGIGGFSADGSEYVMRIAGGTDPSRLPPLPWTNVVANPETGFIVSETGATYTWSGNSRENRLTPWLNDPVSDAHAEALYLRDEGDGRVWSPTPGPIPGRTPYEVRHGLGASHFHTDEESLSQDVSVFVPADEPVKIVRVRVVNRGDRQRTLSLYWYAQLVLGVLPHESAPHIEVTRDEQSGALFARNDNRREFSERVAFATLVAPHRSDASFTADRAEVLGEGGSTASPSAVLDGRVLEGRTGRDLDACAAFRVGFEIAAGETFECAFLLGECEDADRARAIVRRFADVGAVNEAMERARQFWTRFTSGIVVDTPSRELNVMVNRWLPYQNLSCRMWGRSAFYQSGALSGSVISFRIRPRCSISIRTSHAGRSCSTRRINSSKETCCTGGIRH